ncbi:flagellar hook-associated protein FlgK [Paenibacillus crassostreae]|uniref:Flagellar hook-associated protein 1 n=1 Tax=Paenibacillus crassostreae TaxID=1763538 RepID=A0A167D891_9BACL|nr:flagellar hook-associated protein FlgK [Paenibacillus crassostreae]AOZ93235.1 flagellar hook-associated protein FlgK [Paenibacillus crassostreae]OAB74058.1 flagellar biosynthesis protein FlgK [Paenibacillus crassostreae]
MTSTFHSIETSKRSLFTQTAALSTTGHNIANANTAGYSRQVVKMTESIPMAPFAFLRSTAPGQLGTGSEFVSIERVRVSFLDDQFRNESSSQGAWDVKFSTLEKLEATLNEPSDSGLAKVINNFWDAWSDFSQDPQDITNRKIVKETTLALTDALNQMSTQMSELTTDLTSNLALQTSSINSLLSQVGGLNANIAKIEGLGDNANDLRDQRDYAIDQLSKLANVQVTPLENGYQVTLAGQVVVTGDTVTEITPETLQAGYAGGTLTSGETYGTIYSRDVYVADYQNQLNQLVNSLANGDVEITIPAGSIVPEGTILNGITYSNANNNRKVASDLTVTVQGINGLHKLGYTLAGDSPVAGGDFFVSKDGSALTAGNVTLSQLIQDDPNNIASSIRTDGTGTDEKVVAGNNSLALLMSGLKNGKFDFGTAFSKPATIDDYFTSIVGQIGVESKEVGRQVQNAQLLTDQVDASRQSISGVSLDEEMSNMIKFQHAYSAASRFMTTMDELLNKLINSTGVVGR